MPNRNSSAETAADSSKQPIVTTSADIEASPMLGDVVLSEIEQKWFDRLKMYLQAHEYDYACSWWLRLEYKNEGITTTKINYVLSKLAAKGILKKETTRSYTKFSLNIA